MSLKEKLHSYRINSAFTDGVDIRLDAAPDVVFKVRLPGQYNRAYMADVYGAIDIELGSEGVSKAKTNVLAARAAQTSAFVNHCLLSVDGEPVPDDFADEYPEAVDELMMKANQLLSALNDEVEAAAKKAVAYIDWQRKWSDRLDFYSSLVERGRIDPNDVEPEVGRYRPILGAVMELSTERQIGMSVGPIPVSAIYRYLKEYGLPDWWAPVIVRIDSHLLADATKQLEAASA